METSHKPDVTPRSPSPLARRVSSVAVGLIVATLSLGAALVLSEVLVRFIAPQQLISKRPDIFQPDDTLGWTHRSNVMTQVNTGERTVRFVTDSQGFRVGHSGRVESSTRVLLIGDSFMEAVQVEYEQSVAGVLESRLSAALGFPVAVRNTAVGGWEPDQYLLQLQRALAHDSFSVALVALSLATDVVDSRRERVSARPASPVHRLHIPRTLAWSEFVDAVLYPVNDFLETRSHLFILGKTRFRNALIRVGLSAVYFPGTLLRSKADAPMWANTVSICADMAALARAHRMPIMFLLLPDVVQVQRSTLVDEAASFGIDPANVDVDQPNRRLGALMAEQGLTVLDATDTLRAVERAGERLYGKVDSHFSPAGHVVAGAYLEPTVLAALKAARKGASRGSRQGSMKGVRAEPESPGSIGDR